MRCVTARAGCGRRNAKSPLPQAKAFGAALVEVSGGKQIAIVGSPLDQPLIVQVNDAQGAPVAGAALRREDVLAPV